MNDQEHEQNKAAMLIVAHPDDAEFGAAGTIATWVRDGWVVYYVICTDATGGGPDDATTLMVNCSPRLSYGETWCVSCAGIGPPA